jgi:hypothetical protein
VHLHTRCSCLVNCLLTELNDPASCRTQGHLLINRDRLGQSVSARMLHPPSRRQRPWLPLQPVLSLPRQQMCRSWVSTYARVLRLRPRAARSVLTRIPKPPVAPSAECVCPRLFANRGLRAHSNDVFILVVFECLNCTCVVSSLRIQCFLLHMAHVSLLN